MSLDLSPFIAMVYRHVKRWWSARSRVISVFLNPLLWMIFMGLGMSTVFTFTPKDVAPPGIDALPNVGNIMDTIAKYVQQMVNSRFGGLDYATFMVSGMATMSVFMGSFIAGISVIWDKQFGFLKESLVAPAPRGVVILGRIVGDSIINTFNGFVVMCIGFTISRSLNPLGVLVSLPYLFITSIAFTSLGIVIALKLASIEGFQMIINIFNMPVMFLSGVFYPITTMPEWMKHVAIFNPLSYTVHGVRYWLTGADVGIPPMNPLLDLAVLTFTSIVFAYSASKIFEKTTLED
ncbi:MAG: ABC transporter permease [Ignisphaera sp.]|uniref:ABC transporter n=1 Tax=Ignisphaera aggregans TaxID=334771 RepID=A0A832ASN6_9CREN